MVADGDCALPRLWDADVIFDDQTFEMGVRMPARDVKVCVGGNAPPPALATAAIAVAEAYAQQLTKVSVFLMGVL